MKVKPSGKKQRLGRAGEDWAADYLQRNGFKPLARNFRNRWGEIDMVAVKKGEYYFVEVKTRRDDRFGEPIASLPWFRIERLRKMAALYAVQKKLMDKHLHLSLLGVDLSQGEPQITFIPDIE